MTVLAISTLLTLMGAFGTVLAGRHSRRIRRFGWGIGFLSEPVWIAFSVMVHAYPLIVSSVIYAGIFAWNWKHA